MELDDMNNIVALDEYRAAPAELLSEADHRIANHLGTVMAMIRTQARAVRQGPVVVHRERVGRILDEALMKIVAISHLHRRLAVTTESGSVDLGDLLIEFVDEIVTSLGLANRLHVRHTIGGRCLVTKEQASKLILITSEVVMNAVKYAHPTDIPIEMTVSCRMTEDGRPMVEIADDGTGLPEGFDTERDGGFGFRLIRNLTKKIGASLRIESDALGLSFHLVLPSAAAPASA